jgi:hypothetical protein
VVSVNDDASAGTRALVLTTTHGTHRFEDAFTVIDVAEGPRVLEVFPDQIVQGRSAVIGVWTSEDFAGPVKVFAPEGLLVTAPVDTDGASARLSLAAAGTAAPGQYSVVLDDGARLWSFEVEILDYVFSPRKYCSNVSGVASLWFFLPFLMRRRRP